jgi:hypothetical protein
MVSSDTHDGHSGANGATPEPQRADRLELQEQYTLDNPPVSYEQRTQREKKGELKFRKLSAALTVSSSKSKDQSSRKRGSSSSYQLPLSHE